MSNVMGQIDPSQSEFYINDGENTSLRQISGEYITKLLDSPTSSYRYFLKLFWTSKWGQRLQDNIGSLGIDSKDEITVDDIHNIVSNTVRDLSIFLKSVHDSSLLNSNVEAADLINFGNICLETVLILFSRNINHKNPKLRLITDKDVISEILVAQKNLRDIVVSLFSSKTSIDPNFGNTFSLSKKNEDFANIANELRQEGKL